MGKRGHKKLVKRLKSMRVTKNSKKNLHSEDDDEEEMREARSILSTSLSDGLIVRRF